MFANTLFVAVFVRYSLSYMMSLPNCGLCNQRIAYHDDKRCTRCLVVFHARCVPVYEDSQGATPFVCGNCGPDAGSRVLAASTRTADPPVQGRATSAISNDGGTLLIQSGESASLLPAASSDYVGTGQFQEIMARFQMMFDRFDSLASAVNKCNASVELFGSILSAQGFQLEACKDEIDNLKKENSAMKDTITRLEDNMRSIGESPQNPVSYIELRNRIECEKNLIMIGVPEEADPSEDMATVQRLLHDAISPSLRVGSAARLGGPGRGSGSGPRLLKVDLLSRQNVMVVLQNKSKLSTGGSTIRVRRDLTANQRRDLAEARKVLNERERNGEAGLTIKFLDGNPTVITGPTSSGTPTRSNDNSGKKRFRQESSSPRNGQGTKSTRPS